MFAPKSREGYGLSGDGLTMKASVALLCFFFAFAHAQGDSSFYQFPPSPYGPHEPDSPYSYPSPNATGRGGWDVAIAKAKRFVSRLTVDEKVSICTGNGFPQEIPPSSTAMPWWLTCMQSRPVCHRPHPYLPRRHFSHSARQLYRNLLYRQRHRYRKHAQLRHWLPTRFDRRFDLES